VFSTCNWSDLDGSLHYDPLNPRDHRSYKQHSRENVKPLIEFVKSGNDHHIYRNGKHVIHIVPEVLTGLGLGHQRWIRTKSPFVEGGNDRDSIDS
jgi:hypothetical protein